MIIKGRSEQKQVVIIHNTKIFIYTVIRYFAMKIVLTNNGNEIRGL